MVSKPGRTVGRRRKKAPKLGPVLYLGWLRPIAELLTSRTLETTIRIDLDRVRSLDQLWGAWELEARGAFQEVRRVARARGLK